MEHLERSKKQNRAAVEVRHLRYCIAASDHGSFRKAAAALGVQMSTISRAIRDLEDRLGASLFQRHVGGVDLTYAGEQFLHRARIALEQINGGIRDVNAVGRAEIGRIRVGIFSSLAGGFLSDLLRTYDRDHPKVRIDLSDGNAADQVAAIRGMRLDVAFLAGTENWPDCEIDNLWSEQVFAVLPAGSALADKQCLEWSDLAEETFIVGETAPGPYVHNYLVQRIANLGIHPDIQPQRVGRDNLLSLVAVGRGLTITSEATTVARIPGVVFRPIAGEVLSFSAVWSPKNDNPAFRRFLSRARTISACWRSGERALVPSW
ncbi:LysR family transcriptional regulator [uncultured Roseibium sp.]|uniref:LysR family transcriptional regulator n=1 Tax=uncultured Roseibium sp. TaxID=1936171 RepID=UPI0032163678